MQEKTFYTDYYTATHWLGNSFILCNEIVNDYTVNDNVRFSYYDEETDTYTEIYQYFLTNCSESEVEFLEKHFNLLFSYSDKLDLFVLCVDHWGTDWNDVPCEIVSGDTMLIDNINNIGKLI